MSKRGANVEDRAMVSLRQRKCVPLQKGGTTLERSAVRRRLLRPGVDDVGTGAASRVASALACGAPGGMGSIPTPG